MNINGFETEVFNMAENENGQSPASTNPAHPPARPVTKKVVVKRVKVPVARPAAAKPAPVPAAPVSGSTAEGEKPAARASAPEPVESAPEGSNAPAAKEPELPPEDKSEVVASPVEAEEIEKEPPRKRRRSAQRAPAVDPRAEKIKEAKEKAKKLAGNRNVRLGIAGFVLLVVIVSVWAWLPSLAENKIPELLEKNGVKLAAFQIKEVTTSSMELTGLRDTSGTASISNVKASYSLTGLMFSNRIDSLTVSGVTVTGKKTNEGVSFGALSGVMTAPMQVSKDNPMTIDKISVSGQFILEEDLPEEAPAASEEAAVAEEVPPEGAEAEEEEPEGPFTVNFSANGSWKPAGLNLNLSTDVENKQLVLRAQGSFFKSPASSEIKAEVTEGDVKEKEETVGSVTGTFELAVQNGALQKGMADMVVATPVQDVSVKADIAPAEDAEGFNMEIALNRSFKNPKDGYGKFAGDLKMHAKGLKMSGNLQKFEGSVPLSLESDSLTTGNLALRNLKTSADFSLSCDTGACSYVLSKPWKTDLGFLSYAGRFRQFKTYDALSLTVNAAKEPFLTSKGADLAFRLPLSGFVAKMLVTDRTGSTQTVAAVNGAKAAINYNPFAGTFSGRMAFAQSGYADRNIRLTNAQGMLSFDHANLPALDVKVGSAALVKQGILPVMAGELRLKPMKGAEYGVDLSVRTQNGLVGATAQGSYVLPSNEWSLLVDVPEQTFSDSGLKLSEIFPSLAGSFVKEPSGSLALKGRVAVKDGKVLGPVKLSLRDVSVQWGKINAEHMNGVLEINSLYPFETAANQQLFVGTLNFGIPFKNALFSFKVDPTAGVHVDSLKMAYADGQFKNIKAFSVPFNGAPSSVYLEGRGINLEFLSRNFKQPYLKTEGFVDSEWKLSLKDGAVFVESARFQTKLAGLLEFDVPSSVDLQMDKNIRSFLKNVIVKDLLFAMKGPMDGVMNFKLGIEGRSPLDETETNEEVSLSFTGSLANFLNQTGAPFEVPSDIQLSLQNFNK